MPPAQDCNVALEATASKGAAIPGPGRAGPRPLPLHLISQAAILNASLSALPFWNAGWPSWSPPLRHRAAELKAAAAAVAPEAFAAAVEAEGRRRLDAFLRGVLAYRRHPYRRDLPEPPTVWHEGTSRLLDYRPAGGAPVLMVPSLINRAYILDLSRRRSLARYLAERGLRPYLLDWGAPGEAERGFGLDAYVAGRLARALDAVTAREGGPPAVLGYCMGGTMAVALAGLRPVRALALLAAPWDFHAAGPAAAAAALEALAGPIERGIAAAGELPVEVIQALFASVDPTAVPRKFQAFARLRPESARARDFVAVEDWLNDGVPLAPAVARECLFGWYGRNEPAAGAWRVGGSEVRPQAVTAPALVVLPTRDRIVPPESAGALLGALPKARARRVETGHIGLVAGRRARTDVYAPLARWLANAAVQ